MNASPLALSGPFFFFAAALSIAALAYLLHRWPALSGLVSAAGSLFLGWIALQLLLKQPVSVFGRALLLGHSLEIFGREWVLTTPATAILAFIFALSGLAFLLALPASQGWAFYPFGMGVLGVLTLAVTAQQYLYLLLFLWLAANLAVFVLSGGRPGATMGAFRFLALTTLAVMPLSLASHFIEIEANAVLLRTASVLNIIGFSILLMLPPFHGQLVAAAAHAAPMTLTLILTAFSPLILYAFFLLGQAHPPWLEDGFMFDLCRWMGVGAVMLGGIAAVGQRRWGSLVGYAALVDWGAGLIAIGQGTQAGLSQAAQMIVWRAFALLLVGGGLVVLFRAAGKKDDLAQCQGLLYRRPLNVLALTLGLLSLAGFPLTPGAIGRWPLIFGLLESDPKTAWILILASGGVAAGAVSGLLACLGAPKQAVGSETGYRRLRVVIDLGFGLGALWLVGRLFLSAPLWIEIIQRALTGFSFLPG